MRTTITLDDELFAAASAALGITERSVVLHEGLKLLVQRDAARRLSALGGSDPTASLPPRRRSKPSASAARPKKKPRSAE